MPDDRDALFNRVAGAFTGAATEDAVFVLTFMLARCLHQLTEGQYNSGAMQEASFLVMSAYAEMCGDQKNEESHHIQ